MEKKEAVTLVILVVLSLLVLSAIFFRFSSTDAKNFIQEKVSAAAEKRENARQQEQQTREQTRENQTGVNTTIPSTAQQSNGSSNASSISSAQASSSWCTEIKTTQVQSDIYGEGLGTKVLVGLENITLGKNISVLNVTCGACHYKTTYKDTGRIVDEWSDKQKLLAGGFNPALNECSLFIASKTFLYSNKTDVNGTITISLAFSNKTYVKESWHDSQGKLCMYINKIPRSERGAKCT